MEEVSKGIEHVIDGQTVRAYSVTRIDTIDLLSEGLIQGLISGEHKFKAEEGQIGYSIDTDLGVSGYQYTSWAKGVGSTNPKGTYRSIYWNQVPVVDAQGLANFQQFEIYDTEGEPNGKLDVGGGVSPETTRTRTISERLRGPTAREGVLTGSVFPKIYRILNPECAKIEVNIKVNALYAIEREVWEKIGDIKDTAVQFDIKYKPIFNDGTAEGVAYLAPPEGSLYTIKGKSTAGFIKSVRVTLQYIDQDNVDLTQANSFLGWEIKLERVTVEAETTDIKNVTFVDSITEIYGLKFAYPNAALVGSKFQGEYFSSIPDRAFETEGMRVKIPSNYDHIMKTYSGPASGPVWNGLFKGETTAGDGNAVPYYTDNPAWIFYDLITNRRYGLGKNINPNLVDKWTLYEIARYCDQMVADGFGGFEPRFTCNLYITTRAEAFKVVNDISSIFRGMAYYSAGHIYAIQDAPKEAVYQFTNASVEDGNFAYQNSSTKVRHTVAIIRYNDKENFYKPAIEYAEDVDGIRKYGIRETEMAAFGCTSRGQAARLGRWVIFTENLETESVSFTAGIEASFLKPGDVINVSDSNRNTKRRAGRIASYSVASGTTTIIFDCPKGEISDTIDDNRTYKLTLLTPSYNYDPAIVDISSSDDLDDIRRPQIQSHTFQGSSVVPGTSIGNPWTKHDAIVISETFNDTDYTIEQGCVWMIEPVGTDYNASDFEEAMSTTSLYRIISVEEAEANKFNVAGIEYNEEKYNSVEHGLSFEDSTVTFTPSIEGNSSVQLSVHSPCTNCHTKEIKYKMIHCSSNANATCRKGLNTYYVYLKFAGTGSAPEHWIAQDFDARYTLAELGVSSWLSTINDSSSSAGGANNQKIPNPEFLIGTPHWDNGAGHHGTFIPSKEGHYRFRVFAVNVQGFHSTYSVNDTQHVSDVRPIEDITIHGLGFSSDVDDNLAGRRITGDSTIPDSEECPKEEVPNDPANGLSFSWLASIIEGSSFSSNLSYRITLREPSSNNTPYSTIFYEIRSFRPAAEQGTMFFTLGFAEHLSVPGGPRREFDIVVEAHDEYLNSSSGGILSTYSGDPSTGAWSNADGYDIHRVHDKLIPAPILTDWETLTECPTANWTCSVQNIELNRDIRILFTKIDHSEWSCSGGDVAGGYVYAWPTTTNIDPASDIAGKQVNSDGYVVKTDGSLLGGVEAMKFTTEDNPITVTPKRDTIRLAQELNICMGFLDNFSLGRDRLDESYHEEQEMQISNKVKITFSTDTLYGLVGQGTNIWIRLKKNGDWIGRGITCVEEIPPNGPANEYGASQGLYGFRRFECSNLEEQFYGPYWFYRILKLNAAGEYVPGPVVSYYCGFVQAYLEGGLKSASPVTYANMTAGKDFKRFRVHIATDATPPDADYAVIGSNARNATYRLPNDSFVNFARTIYSSPDGEDQPNSWMDPDPDGSGTEYGWGEGYPLLQSNPEYEHHPAGFGQGFGGMAKTTTYFDVHMGKLIDASYLDEAYFRVISKSAALNETNDWENNIAAGC